MIPAWPSGLGQGNTAFLIKSPHSLPSAGLDGRLSLRVPKDFDVTGRTRSGSAGKASRITTTIVVGGYVSC